MVTVLYNSINVDDYSPDGYIVRIKDILGTVDSGSRSMIFECYDQFDADSSQNKSTEFVTEDAFLSYSNSFSYQLEGDMEEFGVSSSIEISQT